MSNSKMFKVASEGSGGEWGITKYWKLGDERSMYKRLYGGSPVDPSAIDNYRKYAPSFRAREFAGPLLQQYSDWEAQFAEEFHVSLREAKIPTELVYYPHESHIFWHPHRRASAMQRNLDWFDYWLLGKRNPDTHDEKQYERWDRMKKEWLESKQQQTGN